MKKNNIKNEKKVPAKVLRKQSSAIKSKTKVTEKEPLSILVGNMGKKTTKKSLKFQKILMKTKFRSPI